ncbi:hypothetical protein [Spongiimicrobium sp. 2-473A-2-J]|uniref:hypothetical protein n=1 Tax=Eudoraea algarum TaxID=3417568 RepID=UPI003D35FB3F
MPTRDFVVVRDVPYKDVKSALTQWIALYADQLSQQLRFHLYRQDAYHVISVDGELNNELFFFLVNYLKYPENIRYDVDVAGFTTGDASGKLEGQDVLVYIPEEDTEYDVVYVVTGAQAHYKIDFGGGMHPLKEGRTYTDAAVDFSGSPEVLKVSKRISDKTVRKGISFFEVGWRFKFMVALVLAALIIHFLLPSIINDPKLYDKTSTLLYFGVGMWFFMDAEMLQKDSRYLACLVIAFAIFVYGFHVKEQLQSRLTNRIEPFIIMPLTLLMLQWPSRRLYKLLFKREPAVDKKGKFADMVYSLVLVFGAIFLPFLIVDFLKEHF